MVSQNKESLFQPGRRRTVCSRLAKKIEASNGRFDQAYQLALEIIKARRFDENLDEDQCRIIKRPAPSLKQPPVIVNFNLKRIDRRRTITYPDDTTKKLDKTVLAITPTPQKEAVMTEKKFVDKNYRFFSAERVERKKKS